MKRVAKRDKRHVTKNVTNVTKMTHKRLRAKNFYYEAKSDKDRDNQ
jgi:hypothetical protein